MDPKAQKKKSRQTEIKQSREKKRWRDIFTEKIGPDRMTKQREGKEWRDLGEAYAAQATTMYSNQFKLL